MKTKDEIYKEAMWRFTNGHGATDTNSVETFIEACNWVQESPQPNEEKKNSFDVMKIMSERNMDISLSPMKNLISAQYGKGGVLITIGVPLEIGSRIMAGENFNGGLLLANAEQFSKIEKQ